MLASEELLHGIKRLHEQISHPTRNKSFFPQINPNGLPVHIASTVHLHFVSHMKKTYSQ